jgi:hypothetical protein
MKAQVLFAASRLRAAWGVLTAERCVVVTYDPSKPPTSLGNIYLCAPCQEVPERLANATLVTLEWDKMDSEEGQQDALRQASKILDCSRSPCETQ